MTLPNRILENSWALATPTVWYSIERSSWRRLSLSQWSMLIGMISGATLSILPCQKDRILLIFYIPTVNGPLQFYPNPLASSTPIDMFLTGVELAPSFLYRVSSKKSRRDQFQSLKTQNCQWLWIKTRDLIKREIKESALIQILKLTRLGTTTTRLWNKNSLKR
jgi:hypothetical protein